MRELPLVIPVSADDALAWAAGSLDDLYLLLHAPLIPQAVFVAVMPDLSAWRPMLRQCAFWQRAGAIGLIGRTHSQVIVDHLAPFGFRAVWRENETQWRYLMPVDGFQRWLEKF